MPRRKLVTEVGKASWKGQPEPKRCEVVDRNHRLLFVFLKCLVSLIGEEIAL